MPVVMLRAARDAGRSVVPIPRFDARCACCGEDARGRVQPVTPHSQSHTMRGSIDVPVCDACRGHAIQRTGAAIAAATILILGICTTGLSFGYGGSSAATGATILGLLLLLAGVGTIVHNALVERRERRRDGHHPWLMITVLPGITKLATRNPVFVDALVRLNPSATTTATRAERKRMPAARAVSAPTETPSPPSDPAALQRAVTCLTKNTPESLEQARAMIAAGEVSTVELEHRLGALEATLGRSDLRVRLRALQKS